MFDGARHVPYTEGDTVNPLNRYGQSKVFAERYVTAINPDALVIRTSAFFGPWDQYNFAFQVYKSLSEFTTIKAANDIYISPTYVPDLVNAVLDLIIDDEKGIWHLANKGSLSWSTFALFIAEQFGLDKNYIIELPGNELGFKAARPDYSVLSSSRGNLLPSFEDALNRYAKECRLVSAAVLQPV